MSEEDLADQVASASDTALLEDVLEMLLNGVGRDEERLGDGSGGVAVQHETGHFLLPVSQPVCRHEQWRDASGMGWFDDDRDLRPLMGVCVARGVAWTTIHRPDCERRRTVAGSPARARPDTDSAPDRAPAEPPAAVTAEAAFPAVPQPRTETEPESRPGAAQNYPGGLKNSSGRLSGSRKDRPDP